MNRKNILIFTLIISAISAVPANLVKAQEDQPKVISAICSKPPQGITTNELKPYVLNEKEIATVFGNYSNEIEKLKLHSGYYVFDNEKYGLEASDIYVFISLGKRNSTGYGINVASVEDVEGISKIAVQETKPSSNDMVGESITYPYIIVKFQQGTQNVKVITESETELSPLVNSSELQEQNWTDIQARLNVPINKEWLITFKNNILKENISDDTIYVRDSRGYKVAVDLTVGEDNKTVKVTPADKYEEGQTYYLFVSKTTNSQKDSTNKIKGYRMAFNILGDVTIGDVE
ncbi:protease complex subunit PrcB family protein [Clostridium thailandense]|uniref:protease complex subunit PrcB family protein n=1 Tax=Clostridium thailandense TaxID=2794346 RepID=UPI0039890FEA